MPNTHRRARNKDPDDVESVILTAFSVPIDPDSGRSAQLPPFAKVHRLQRRAESNPATSLDLDERDRVTTPHDQVDIAMTAAKPMRDHVPSVALQPSRGDPLTLQSEGLSLFRHDDTVSTAREITSPKSRHAGQRHAAPSS